MKFQVSICAALALSWPTLSACGGASPSETQSGLAPQAQPAQAESTAAVSGTAGAIANKPAAPVTSSTTPAKSAAAGAAATGDVSQSPLNAAAGNGSTAAAGSGNAVAGASGGAAKPQDTLPPAVACAASDMKPAATPVALAGLSDMGGAIGPTKGPEMPMIEHDPGLSTHTVYRPMTLAEGKKYPVIVWANGGCSKDGLMFARFLLEITSNGFVIVADGEPNGTGTGPLETNGEPQKQALDWITAEAERPCSQFYRKLDTSKIAAMGQSCGGLMTLGASGDKRLSTVVIWNSGMFMRDDKIYAGLHTKIAYFIGGPDDVAYAQAQDDFAAINTVPIFYGNTPVGHFATYSQPNGGEFARVGIGWLKWQLYGDESESGGKMFVGADCELCKNSMWTIEKKMMD